MAGIRGAVRTKAIANSSHTGCFFHRNRGFVRGGYCFCEERMIYMGAKAITQKGACAMKFLIEVGKRKNAKSWLAKREAEEALNIVRELHAQGVTEIHIYDADSFASVTEEELAKGVARRSH
jgi:hypothetical protein